MEKGPQEEAWSRDQTWEIKRIEVCERLQEEVLSRGRTCEFRVSRGCCNQPYNQQSMITPLHSRLEQSCVLTPQMKFSPSPLDRLILNLYSNLSSHLIHTPSHSHPLIHTLCPPSLSNLLPLPHTNERFVQSPPPPPLISRGRSYWIFSLWTQGTLGAVRGPGSGALLRLSCEGEKQTEGWIQQLRNASVRRTKQTEGEGGLEEEGGREGDEAAGPSSGLRRRRGGEPAKGDAPSKPVKPPLDPFLFPASRPMHRAAQPSLLSAQRVEQP